MHGRIKLSIWGGDDVNVERLAGTAWVVWEKEEGVIIDTAKSSQRRKLLKKIDKLGLGIEFILLTHTHYDHMGSAEALREKTGAKVVVGAGEGDCIRKGHTRVPKGTNAFARMMGNAGHDTAPKLAEYYEPVTQDILEIKDDMQLFFGKGKIETMPLGAHSIGSVGYKIGDHYFAGDVVFAIGSIIYPLFADFEEDIKTAWEKILNSGAKYIYPGHGRRLDMEFFKKQYEKRFK